MTFGLQAPGSGPCRASGQEPDKARRLEPGVWSLMKEQLLADVESLTAALKALPPSAAIDKAVYQSERLHLAVRSSHSEATRFAAFIR